ncbi:MAG: SEC-C metal-binding domain-containing protein [Candidatus Dojkabacteria bacterium]|nr:MAG: SEC-C metal-binding domain-containing protein [Candidatus Dojkabacteria bacterium]
MFNLISKLFDSNDKQIKKIQPIINKINELEDWSSKLSDDELAAKTTEFRKKLGVDINKLEWDSEFNKQEVKAELFELLPEAFAIVREAAKRYTDHKHFDVQMVAGYFLADNKISELFTGEGKTNAANLPLYLYALTGRSAHLITVNDYLARRDGEWNGHIFNPLGISVAVVNNGATYKFVSDEEAIERKGDDAKNAIKERDKKRKEAGRLKLDMMDGTNLIEVSKQEAYACDVVYGTNNEFGFDYLRDNMARRLGDRVQRRLHFAIVDEADSILVDEARTPLIISQSAQASNDLYKQFANIVKQINRDEHYTIDEKTNSVALNDAGIDRLEKLLKTDNIYENSQFAYHLENALKAKELYVRDDEYIIRDGEVLIVDEFTGRAMTGRRYSEGLHQAIEAKEGVEVKRESRTLATITLQNYFRLYDFMSGMTATALTEAEEFSNIYKLDVVVVPTNRPVVREDLNDLVYRSEMGKFKAIVNDIKEHHEKGQPMLVGTASVERSEILSNMLDQEGIPHEVLNAKNHEREAKIVQNAGQLGAVTIATNMAGRGTDIALGKGVKELGGLYVIGSERHESRRIDNQLRGRSGRQGDPGTSRFYVSFEDELMRLFAGERVKSIMSSIGMDDDMPISAGMLGNIIESAQKKVEAYNFDIRKRLVEYDDVLNQQRDIVYGLRKRVLSVIEDGDKAEIKAVKIDEKVLKKLDINAILEDIDGFSLKDKESWEVDQFKKYPQIHRPANFWILKRIVDHVRYVVAAQLQDDMKIDNEEERKTFAQVQSLMTDEITESAAKALGYKDFGDFFKDVDSRKDAAEKENLLLQLVIVGFIQHIDAINPKAVGELSRLLILQSIDNFWMEHLDAMGDLREGVGMRSMAQRDPLVEYKNEGFQLFEKMLSSVDDAVVNRFYKVRVVERDESVAQARAIHETVGAIGGGSVKSDAGSALDAKVRAVRRDAAQSRKDERPGETSKQKTVVRQDQKVGRNDPCPCGSGKKYKKCHGKGL